MLFPSLFNAKAPTYEIEQSIRLNESDAAHFYRNQGSDGNHKTFTISFWTKITDMSSDFNYAFYSNRDASTTIDGEIYINNQNRMLFYTRISGDDRGFAPTFLFRDPSAWYHVVLEVDTTDSTAEDRMKAWVNGVRQTDKTYNWDNPTQNQNLGFNRAGSTFIGRGGASAQYGDFYLAEYHFVDGTALDCESFGEFDSNGVWRPIEYTGSHGTQGFYLKFDPDATNGIGHDHSANSNNFTPYNFVTSGTGTDVMSDTPTKNYATLSPLGSSFQTRHTLSDGNLVYTQSANSGQAATMNSQSTIGVSSGKWYWEVSSATNQALGFGENLHEIGSYNSSGAYIYSGGFGVFGSDITAPSGSPTYSSSDIIGFALDLDDDNDCVVYKNGTSIGTFTTIPSRTWFPTGFVNSSGSSGGATFNFGQRAFAYTPPTGFKALNTSNLPAPDVKNPSKNFNSTLYTGVTGSQNVSAGMAPDLAWIKKYSSGSEQSHSLTDRVRGNDLVLQLNETGAETSGDIDLTSTGVTIGDDNALRGENGVSYVLWSWLAGGSGSADTSGTIDCTLSANATAGCSIIKYQGTGAQGTLPHGLGVAPSFVILKNIDQTSNWTAYHSELGVSHTTYPNWIYPHLGFAEQNSSSSANHPFYQRPGNSFLYLNTGTSEESNVNGEDHIAYCFAEVNGFFKVGYYQGTGNSYDRFIYCGFKPALIVIKSSSHSTTRWEVFDSNVNDNRNPTTTRISWSDKGIATDYSTPDFLSNGFNLKGAAGYTNDSGVDYIWMAWAENPFGGDGVSPATAR